MGTFVDIQGDPDELGGKGALLSGMAATLQARSASVLSEIQAIEGEQPWGHDKYADGFLHSYNTTPDGDTKPLKDTAQQGLADAGGLLTNIGDRISLAMGEYQGTDWQNSRDIDSAQA